MSCPPRRVLFCLMATLAAPVSAGGLPSLELITRSAPAAVLACVEAGIEAWRIPDDYFERSNSGLQRHSLQFFNPASGNIGFRLVAEPGVLRLFEYGPALSAKWRRLFSRCAGL
ncbi:hypothetical protein [Crenobacter intestini]|uniref:Uncharacterized protein n=1 Tax=Crenobacter intestini TaxID=2563443 RepID=A0A4T0V407_9NEIS|nr:hypothetical protein [Crenobacter intestini]TIC86091.1 hypothetical protein E5K04_03025 [Crenobacter intestini]